MPKVQDHHKNFFSSCSQFSAHHLHIEFKVRVRFPSQHQHRLNSGSIPEFNTKCGFDSCIYDKQNFIQIKKLKFGRAVTFINLKAGKIIQIQYFFSNKKLTFVHFYVHRIQYEVFFGIFKFFFRLLAAIATAVAHSPRGSSSSVGSS
jgi:hypothetical protein